jgi:hypothetical protein
MFEKIASGAGEVPLYEARHFSAVGQSAASPVGRFLLNLRYSFQKNGCAALQPRGSGVTHVQEYQDALQL